MSLKQTAIRGVQWTFLSTVVLIITQLIMNAMLARMLTKAELGVIAIIILVRGFAELFMDFGITVAILHKPTITNKEYSSLYWINMIIGFLLFIIILCITPIITSFYAEDGLMLAIPMMCLAIPISSIGRQQKTMLQKELFFKKMAFVEIVSSIISLAVMMYMVMQGFGVYSLIISTLIRYLLANSIFFFLGMRTTPITLHLSIKETAPFFKIGAYNTGGQIINYFSKNFDIIIIGKLLGMESVGIYNLAKDLVLKPSTILSPVFFKVITPLFSKLQDEKEAFYKMFLKVLQMSTNISTCIYAAIAILATPVIYLYYGPGYEKCVPIVIILCGYYLLREYGQPIGLVCIAKGRTDIDMWWNVLMLIISPACIFVGALFSIEAVALALLLSTIAMFYPGWHLYARRLIDIPIGAYYSPLAHTIKIYALPAIITILLMRFTPASPLWSFLIGGSIFTVTLSGSFYWFDRIFLKDVCQIMNVK